jgi:kynurenine formamidase
MTGGAATGGDDRSLPQPTSSRLAPMARAVSNWGRWGDDDELGTLNHITPERRRAAAALVRSGEVVSLSRPLTLGSDPDLMQTVHLVWRVFEPVEGASEYLGLAFHGAAVTHVDALNHIHAQARMFNGYPASELAPKAGSEHLTVEVMAQRMSGRGLLLDVARSRGVERLEVGTTVGPDDLDAAEELAGARAGPGDLVFVRTGSEVPTHHAGSPGLDAACVPWLHERDVAVLGSDVSTDAIPAPPAPWELPVHQLAILYMGMPLIDNCALHALAARCAELGRYEFFAVVAPLRLQGGTGSPVNPLAFL